MLKKIRVKNYKCFKDLTFDLTAADYSFNQQVEKDGIVNKALVFGKNGSGKSSLGFAIFDLVQHLTDKEKFPSRCMQHYKNLSTNSDEVFFQYTFSFDFQEVVYTYEKNAYQELIYEKLEADGKVWVDYHYGNAEKQFVDASIRGSLNINLPDNRLSVLKYIYNNTPTGAFPVLTKMMDFCENMLWFRSTVEGNWYCGLTTGTMTLASMLYNSGKILEFKEFLKKAGLDYDLGFEDNDGQVKLYAYFDNRKNKALFSSIASSGTLALWLLFCWKSLGEEKISLLFIDEFDAFYHYELASEIVAMLNKCRSFQSIVTTHNIYLMQNKFTRPDGCYLLTDTSIKNLKSATDRELREAHNLEKMYVNGAFGE